MPVPRILTESASFPQFVKEIVDAVIVILQERTLVFSVSGCAVSSIWEDIVDVIALQQTFSFFLVGERFCSRTFVQAAHGLNELTGGAAAGSESLVVNASGAAVHVSLFVFYLAGLFWREHTLHAETKTSIGLQRIACRSSPRAKSRSGVKLCFFILFRNFQII